MSQDGRVTGLRYVALGDSYTIGTAAIDGEDWPRQLVDRMAAGGAGADGPGLELVANLGVNGFTSQDVIDKALPQLAPLRPQLVSLLVGVNDVVQGVPAAAYATRVQVILDALLLQIVPARIVTVATPDYTVTPRGGSFGDPRVHSAAIRANNDVLRATAGARGIAFVDILDLSLRAAGDRSLVARDGLHPSGAQYALWVDRIEPVVRQLLAE